MLPPDSHLASLSTKTAGDRCLSCGRTTNVPDAQSPGPAFSDRPSSETGRKELMSLVRPKQDVTCCRNRIFIFFFYRNLSSIVHIFLHCSRATSAVLLVRCHRHARHGQGVHRHLPHVASITVHVHHVVGAGIGLVAVLLRERAGPRYSS